MRTHRRQQGERGETLIEVLLALLVVGIGAVAILLAFTSTIIGSSEYRTLATVDTVLRSAAESATSQIQQQPASAWANCSDTSVTAVVFTASTGYALPAGYTVQSPLTVQYWNPAATPPAFQSTCVPNSAQLVTLTVLHNGTQYPISFVVNDPFAASLGPPGAATHLAFIGQPGSTISGSPVSPSPVVAVEDVNDNVVTSDLSPVQITITPGSGTPGAALSSTCAGVEFYGVVTFSNCSIAMTGTGYTLTATDGTLTSATSNTFSVLPAPASQLVFSKVPSGGQSVSATATSGAYQVQEQDVYGNPVAAAAPVTLTLATSSSGTTGFAPFFSLTSGGASATATTTITIPTGATTSPSFYYSDTQAGTPTLTASNPTLIDATTTVTTTPGAATTLVYTTPPPAATSTNTKFSVVVAEQDQYGNVETTDSSTNVTLTSTSGGFSCTTRSPARLSSGTVTFSNCSYSTSGTSFTLTASAGSLTPAVATTTVVGPPSKLVYTTPPPASTSTGTTFSVVVTEQDASGNTEAGDSTTTLALHASGGGFSCTTSPTHVTNGVATYSGCSYTVPSGTAYTLTASSTGLASATATTTVVSTPSKLALTTPPPASTSMNTPFTVVVAEQDNFGNTITTDSTTAVALAANNGGGGFSCTVTPTHVTNGVATYSGCSYTIASGTAYTLTASSTGLTSATATTVVAGVATQLVYTTAPPATSVAGTPFSVVVAEEDTFGNTETTDSSTPINLAANNGGGGLHCSVAPLKVTNGVATFTGCAYTIASATPYTLTASSGVLTSATANTTVTTGPAFKLVYTTAPPATVVAGGTFSVVVAEQDVSGNTETGDSSTAVALAANNGGGGFSCSTTPTHVTNGVATYSGCSYTIASGTAYTLTASSAGLTSATASTTVSAGTATKLVYTTPPPATVAAGTTFSVVVAEQDGFSNTEVGDNATALALTANNGGGGFTCTVTPAHVTAGVATFTGCRYTIASGTAYTLTASSTGLASATATTTVSAGTATKLVYTTPPPPTTTAGTTFSVTVAEEDGSGNVELGDSTTAVALAANLGGGGFSCTVAPAHVTSGVASFTGCSYTIASASAYTLTASSTGLTSATATTTVSAGTATKLVYTTAPPATTTVGTTFTVVVAEQDGYGNTELADSTTALTLTASGGGFTCAVAPTHVSAGVATYTGCKYTTASLTPYTLTAAATGLASATATTHVIGPATKLVYTTPPPATVPAGTAFSVTVAEEDVAGSTEILDNTTTLSLAASGGGGGFACTNTPTHVTAGVATYTGCSYTVASATAYTLTASSTGLTSATATTTVSPGTSTKLVYTTSPPATTTAGTTLTVTVAEEDPYNNVETGDSTTTLTLSANNGGGGFSCSVAPTHVTSGVATFTGCKYTIASATPYTLTAAATGLISATATTTVAPGAAHQLAYTTPPPVTTTAGTTFTVVVAEQDANGNTETGDSTTTLALTATGGSGFTCTTTPTKVTNGLATYSGCSYTVASGSAYTLTASSTGLTSATATTTVSAGTAAKLVYTTAPPASTTAGTTFTVVVAEQDANGNTETADSSTTLALAATAGSGFSCTTTPTKVTNGVATYSGCSYTVASRTAYTLTASATGLTSATATTTVSHAAASKLAFTTSPQLIEPSTTSGTLTVQAQDQYGNPVPAPSGGYAVTLTTSSTHGTFAPVSPLTIAAGTSSASFTYEDTATGAPTLTAKVAALANPTATQVETVLSNAADTGVAVANQTPSPVSAGSTATYTVTITNTGGGTRDYALTSVSGLPQGASASGLASTCVAIRSNGRNTATATLTITTSATSPNGTSTLAVVATAYSSTNGTCSGTVLGTGQGNGTLALSAPATQLVFVQQPSNVVHNASITPAITVLLVDDNFDAVATTGVPVTLAIGTNPGGGTLSGGGPTNTAASGVAAFSTTKISLAGVGYTLTATSAGLTGATSTAFNVT